MAEAKNDSLEREYVIPLRKEYMKVPNYKRTAKSVKAIKEFIAKHMKVPGRDVDNVKLDSYLNNEIWFRGGATPPPRVKVKAIKTGDIVRVTFVQDPERVVFAKQRHANKHFKVDKKVTAPVKKEDTKTEDKAAQSAASPRQKDLTSDEKKTEEEKGKSVAAANEKIAEAQAKAQSHVPRDAKAHKKEPNQRRRTIASS